MNFESKVVELYRSGKSGVKISSELDVPVHKVYYALQKAGVDRRSNRDNSRRYRVNHNYFSIIDTPEKAYWLGFFFADEFQCFDYIKGTIGILTHPDLTF